MSDTKRIKKVEDTGEDNSQAKEQKPDSRRKLIKAGILTAPVLLTLMGKPAKAHAAVSAGSVNSN
jgi:hypothetical protein